MSDVTAFYDALAPNYHLIFADWSASIARQGRVIDALIRGEMGDDMLRVLDCACGIGTQVLGLAQHEGYNISGTDISPKAIARAQVEAKAQGVEITFSVADMRELEGVVQGEFDVVMAMDNALPHLIEEDDLKQALFGIYGQLCSGGLFIASIRDYDALLQERPEATSHRVMPAADGKKRISFQVWEWDEDVYAVTQFIVEPTDDDWVLHHTTTHYRALQRHRLTDMLIACGFENIRWLMPETSGFFQPIVLSKKLR